MKYAALVAIAVFGPGLAAAGPQARPTPVFDPAAFFEGRTEGQGRLKIMMRSPYGVHVKSRGRVERDGLLVLEQDVFEDNEKPKHRVWRLRPTGAGRYAGTLSDAASPVAGRIAGNMLLLTFRMKRGLNVEQRLYLQPGGRIALNEMTVRKLGMTVAHLSETIRRVD